MTIVNRAMGVAEQAVDALKAGLGENLLAVALFGSRARGDERPGSDWDLFVLADALPEHPLDRQTSPWRVGTLRKQSNWPRTLYGAPPSAAPNGLSRMLRKPSSPCSDRSLRPTTSRIISLT